MTILADEYIPTGRTSLIREGSDPVQVQTEYAPHPSPRMTTTVSMQGRVIQKVELKLKRPLASVEECTRAEMVLNRQHTEVVSIIKDQNRSLAATLEQVASMDIGPDLQKKAKVPVDETGRIKKLAAFREAESSPPNESAAPVEDLRLSAADRIRGVPGIEYLFHLDNAGNFFSRREEVQFRKLFRKVAKSIQELIEVFAQVPGSDFLRESGVYEVKRDRLYFMSTGEDCYFVTVVPIDAWTDYEVALRQATVVA